LQKISSITLSMLLSSLSVAQRRKSNKRTKKNKITWKESNEFMKKVDKIKKQKNPLVYLWHIYVSEKKRTTFGP